MSNETEETEAKDVNKKPMYKFHPGSIRVSGKSQVFKTGLSAFHEWRKGTRPVEFVFLGGNAGHQTYKAAVVTKREIEAVCKTEVAFIPLWSTVMTDSQDGRAGELKDVSIWRIKELKQAEKRNFKKRSKKPEQESARNIEKTQDSFGSTLTKQKPFVSLQSALKPVEAKGDLA